MSAVLWDNKSGAGGATNAVRPLTHPLGLDEKGAAAMVREPDPTTCSGPTCDRPARCRGLCDPHYHRLRALGDPHFDRPLRGKTIGGYAPELVALVRRLYLSGQSVEATAGEAGISVNVAYTLMNRHGIARRSEAPPTRYGVEHPNWQGSSATYSALHHRVNARRGRPKQCDQCGKTDPRARYEWANVSGRYDDVDDYRRLCVPCHRTLDAERRADMGCSTVPAPWRP